MKQLIIICGIIASSNFASAQGPAHWDENTGRTTSSGISQGNALSNIEMEVNGKLLTFSHVPQLSQEIKVVITNAQGEEVANKNITPLNAAMDLQSLRKGKMYFVTLQLNNKSQKAFTIHL